VKTGSFCMKVIKGTGSGFGSNLGTHQILPRFERGILSPGGGSIASVMDLSSKL